MQGTGSVHLVPPMLYHLLTFGRSWSASGEYAQSYWCGEKVRLHVMVYQLLHPQYIPSPDFSIDHVNHEESDNTEANLRPATQSLQIRNQRKRAGCSSKYRGVTKKKHNKKNPWLSSFIYRGKKYLVGYFATEEAAFLALSARKSEVIVD